jgi:hypothetical protein
MILQCNRMLKYNGCFVALCIFRVIKYIERQATRSYSVQDNHSILFPIKQVSSNSLDDVSLEAIHQSNSYVNIETIQSYAGCMTTSLRFVKLFFQVEVTNARTLSQSLFFFLCPFICLLLSLLDLCVFSLVFLLLPLLVW